jgi:TPR repeat protein
MATRADKALARMHLAAERGHAQAQYELGCAYMAGDGVGQDESLGFANLFQAAKQFHPAACFEVGLAYQEGKGVEKDLIQAVGYYKRAANREYAPAYMQLFCQYINKEYPYADDAEAAMWLKRAAKAGDYYAQYVMGESYQEGWFDFPVNKTLSALWKRKAAHQGYPKAIVETAYNYQFGEGVRANAERAFYWRKRAAAFDAAAQYFVGLDYWKGNGVRKNIPLAKAYFYDSAMQNMPEGLNAWGWICLTSSDDAKRREALPYFEKAAEAGLPDAKLNLGEIYYRGEIVGQDKQKALQYFQQVADDTDDPVEAYIAGTFLSFMVYDGEAPGYAGVDAIRFWQQVQVPPDLASWPFLPDVATFIRKRQEQLISKADAGDVKGAYNLGLAYEMGIQGFARDLEKAAYWYAQAAQKGDANAQNALAGFYRRGKGRVGKDMAKALRLYVEAARGGDESASMNLAALLLKGKEVPKNKAFAYALYQAAANGDAPIPEAKKYSDQIVKKLKKKERKAFLKKVPSLKQVLEAVQALADKTARNTVQP